jgi:hypothetical protein
MPKLIKMYIKHCAIGFAIAAAFVAVLLWFNVMNLWGMVSHDPMGWLAVLVLWISNGIVFAGVQFAYAIMAMADDEDDDDHHGGSMTWDVVPVRVEAKPLQGQLPRR